MPATSLRMGPVEWGLLLLLSLIWGGSFLFGRIAVQEVPPLTTALARVGIAAAILVVVVVATGSGFPRDARTWGAFLVMGFVNNVVPFSLILWGQQEIGAGLASVFNATTPLFTAVLAHLLTTDEKLRSNKLVGVALGVAGVAVLVGPQALSGLGHNVVAEAALLVAAFSYGCAGVWGRRFRGIPPLSSACAQLTCSTLILLPIAATVDAPLALPLPSLAAIGSILGLAVLCTAIAYVIFFTIVKRAGATNVMLVTLMIPPSAILLGAVFLGERLQAADLAGAVIIGIALVVIDGRVLAGLGRGRSAPAD